MSNRFFSQNNDRQVAGYATQILVFVWDTLWSLFTWSLAAFLLHGFSLNGTLSYLFTASTLLLLALRTSAYLYLGTNNLILRYVGEKDYKTVFFAVTASSVTFMLLLWVFFSPVSNRTIAIVIVDYLFVLAFVGGSRIGMRLLYDRWKRPQNDRLNTAIFGAGELGSMLERVLQFNTSHQYQVVAFFDDNPKVHRKLLNGIPICNPEKSFEETVLKYKIQVVIIGIRELHADRRATFINQCLSLNLKVLKLPPTESWLNGTLEVAQLRDVNLEDLLSRPPIHLEDDILRAAVHGKVVLVTGCAGSIGSEIVRQLLRQRPERVVGVDQAESPLAELSLSLQDAVSNKHFVPVLANICDLKRMSRLFECQKPAYVFHAAAYKHVPIMEEHPEESIKVNVLGTKILADLAVENGVEKFVMVSTDKAVNPGNVMGASKRIAEIYVQSLNFSNGHHTQFITTRFGNVLGSNGSVIPIFREQIEKRLPLTVTHPDITRYFMTIPEACQLVLEAGAMGNGGEIFVFDMGEPVRILDLAHKMIRLAGLVPEKDIQVTFTGLRPGEKLWEELLDDKEHLVATHHPKIRRAQVRLYTLNDIQSDVTALISGAQNGMRVELLVGHMKALVPEFMSHNSVYAALDEQQKQV